MAFAAGRAVHHVVELMRSDNSTVATSFTPAAEKGEPHRSAAVALRAFMVVLNIHKLWIGSR